MKIGTSIDRFPLDPHQEETRRKKGKTTSKETEPIKERKPRTLFFSSLNLRNARHKLEKNARGPPSKRKTMRRIMLAQGAEERNAGMARPTSEKVFQLPIPPTVRPRMDEAFTSGVSSSQRDLGSNEAS